MKSAKKMPPMQAIQACTKHSSQH